MEVLVPIGFFAMIAAIVILPNYLKSKERAEMQATLRAAIEKGQPLPQEMIDAMTKQVKIPATALSDLRVGVIWLAVGIGIAIASYFFSYDHLDSPYSLFGIAAIPVVIGATYIILSFFNPNKGPKS